MPDIKIELFGPDTRAALGAAKKAQDAADLVGDFADDYATASQAIADQTTVDLASLESARASGVGSIGGAVSTGLSSIVNALTSALSSIATALTNATNTITTAVTNATTTFNGYLTTGLGYRDAAAASATSAAGIVAGFARSRYGNIRDKNISSTANPPTQNADGTWKAGTTGALWWTMKAEDDFAPGKNVIWDVRSVSGNYGAAPTIVFVNSSNATLATVTNAAADSNGYRTGQGVVPAGTATIRFALVAAATGDDFEFIIAADAVSSAMARMVQRSRVPIIPRQSAQGIGKRFIGNGQATVGVDVLTGDAAVYSRVIVDRGGTISQASLNAWAAWWEVMVATGIDQDLAAVYPFLGNTLTAGLTPALDRFGYGDGIVPSTFTTWTEALGLSGTVEVDTGLIPDRFMSRFGYMMGADILNEVAAFNNNPVLGQGSASGTDGAYGLSHFTANLMLFDRGHGTTAGRAQGDTRTTYGTGAGNAYTSHTTGFFCAGSTADGGAYLSYDGDQVGSTTASMPIDLLPKRPILIKAGPQNVGLAVIGHRPFEPWKHDVMNNATRIFRQTVRTGVVPTEGYY